MHNPLLPSRSVLLATFALLAIALAALAADSPHANASEQRDPASPYTWPVQGPTTEVLAADRPKLDDFASAKGIFRLKLVGFQNTSWTHASSPRDQCEGTAEGHGTEKVVFWGSKKRVKLSAFGNKKLTSMIFPPMKVKGRVTRKGTYEYTPPPVFDPSCPHGDGGDGPYVPPQPDCGKRTFKGVPVSLFALDGLVELDSRADQDDRPKYVRCPNLATEWPTIIEEKTNGKRIGSPLRANLIFNKKFKRKKKFRKNILIATGTMRRSTFTTRSKTALEWRLTLKRIR